jgi:DNA-binding XRE family transcriptional regulator
VRWRDIRADQVARAGGEQTVQAAKDELQAEMIGHRLAEFRKARGLTQQQIAGRMGVTKGRISQIEQGKVSGHDIVARFAAHSAADSTKPSTSTTATSQPSPDRHPDHDPKLARTCSTKYLSR